MTKKLKVLDLFSGCGGFSLGLHRTGGYSTVGFCEIDATCQKVLAKNFPGVPILKDIRDLKYLKPSKELCEHSLNYDLYSGDIDVITAGWPCQGYSVAGKKRGFKDERSGLWTEVKRVIKEVGPRWVILENSPNLRNLGLARVLQDLWEIGYHNIRWDILSAEAYGAIHKRERIYIIANRDGYGLDSQAHAPAEEAQRRRTEAWADFSRGRCPEPRFYRMDDVATNGLDPSCGISSNAGRRRGDPEVERIRKQRVKQCGNGVYLPIITEIGRYIQHIELANNINRQSIPTQSKEANQTSTT